MERPAFIRVPKSRYSEMSQQQSVNLFRDGPGTPWGFRLVGGKDLNCPLSLQRVTLGTPSEGELRRGDVILRIGNRDATKLSHQEAQNLIKNAGNHLQLVVNRSQYTPQSPDIYGPRPLATLAANATHHGLPRTDFSYGAPQHRYIPPPPPNAPSSQDDDNYDIERERIAVTSQPHRTPVLIQPSVKVKHDTPVGSYLRHVNDPFVRAAPQTSIKHHPVLQHANETLMRARLQESVTSAASNSSGIGSPRGRSETPDSGSVPTIVHRQYNSPIDMYSAQNIAASITGQTGIRVTPEAMGRLVKAAILDYAMEGRYFV
uniref:PDZ domain-containing protein n=1 Tax=Strigamia maritima TaxID=126957 RepID=T1J315_STRMM